MVGLLHETETSKFLKMLENVMETDLNFKHNLLGLMEQFNKVKEKDDNNNNTMSRVSFRDEVVELTSPLSSPNNNSIGQTQNESRGDWTFVESIENTPKSRTKLPEQSSTPSFKTVDWEQLVEEEERKQTPKKIPVKVSKMAKKYPVTPGFVRTRKSILKTTPFTNRTTTREERGQEPTNPRHDESWKSQNNSTPKLATDQTLNDSRKLTVDWKNMPRILSCFLLGDDFFLRMAKNQCPRNGAIIGQEDRIGYCVSGLTIREARKLIQRESDQLTNEKTVLINLGTEDILRKHGVLNMVEDFVLLMENLKNRGIDFVLTTVAPLYGLELDEGQKSNLAKLNKWIRKRKHIDLSKCMTSHHKKINPKFFSKQCIKVNGSRHFRHQWSPQGELRVLKHLEKSLLKMITYETDVDCN